MNAPHEVKTIVLDAISSIAPSLNGVNDESPLLGTGAILDSVGFVNLLITVEQELEDCDLSNSYVDHSELNEIPAVFATVGAMVLHICELTNPKS